MQRNLSQSESGSVVAKLVVSGPQCNCWKSLALWLDSLIFYFTDIHWYFIPQNTSKHTQHKYTDTHTSTLKKHTHAHTQKEVLNNSPKLARNRHFATRIETVIVPLTIESMVFVLPRGPHTMVEADYTNYMILSVFNVRGADTQRYTQQQQWGEKGQRAMYIRVFTSWGTKVIYIQNSLTESPHIIQRQPRVP